MKITEILTVRSKPKDTISCGTTSSGSSVGSALDIVPEMVDNKVLCQPDHSAIAEGVSQIFRRKKGGAPTKGFRCTSGPRKGRIVAKPSTCFAKRDPVKGAKIRKKRLMKAKAAGKKLGMQKRSGVGSRRLKAIQFKKPSPTRSATKKKLQKSRMVKPR